MIAVLPALAYVDKHAATEDILDILRRDGAVCLTNLETRETMQKIQCELQPEFDAAMACKNQAKEGGGFKLTFPELTERVEIVGKSDTADQLLAHPKVMSVIDSVLSEEFPFYFGEPLYHAVSKPQLAAALAIRCRPGNAAQGLHRDDIFNHTIHPGAESQITAIWAATDTRYENGATEVLMQSHMWDNKENPNDHRDEIIYAEMPAGSCLLIYGGLYHAGGHNKTSDETRVVYTFFYNKGYLRQEENSYLSIPRSVIRSKPVHIQNLLGYSVSKPGAGYYKGGDPKAYLKDPGEDTSDLGTQFLY